MKLTNYMMELGRVVAFHPNLKKVTGSTTATILLSQFIYWIDKTKDGWIYKNSYDIEEETGLTVYEQQTARKVLVDLGIITEEYKRLDHLIRFRVNEDTLNDLWEQVSGKQSERRFEEEKPIPVNQPVDLRDFQNPELHKNDPVVKLDEIDKTGQKKGDIIDGMMFYAKSPGARKEQIKNTIREKIEKKLHINTDNKKWEGFIEFVYGRQERHNEPIDKFIEWALKKGFDPIYWTPEKCKTVYPQAFVNENAPRKDFIEPLPERKEENYAPMPDDLKRKRNLT